MLSLVENRLVLLATLSNQHTPIHAIFAYTKTVIFFHLYTICQLLQC